MRRTSEDLEQASCHLRKIVIFAGQGAEWAPATGAIAPRVERSFCCICNIELEGRPGQCPTDDGGNRRAGRGSSIIVNEGISRRDLRRWGPDRDLA